MLCVGLTGGIGCGKSRAAHAFERLGAHILDADLIARELVAPGHENLTRIQSRFGPDSILPDGSLNRPLLRSRVFSDPADKAWLEALLHPQIRQLMRERTRQIGRRTPAAVVMQVIPLLVEIGAQKDVDRVLVIDCSPAVQYQRVLGRGGWTAKDIEAAMASQCPRAERLRHADDIIDNDGSPAALEAQVAQLMLRYRQLAGAD
ncbi:dephospho-CoA kinase [Thermithiobacillus plumbiphilus]|uniref:Dephospho-CoA kinase n=1 Tax=Thermithiobacillus plumbiphilus TaxID=1729899 RepID=A0ABU9D7Q6_9PROT